MDRRSFLKSATGCLGGFSLARQPASFAWLNVVEAAHEPPDASAIFLNQLGYLPSRPKVASVRERGSFFTVRSLHNNAVAHHAPLSAAQFDSSSGDWVQQADFSALKTPGEYTLQLDSGATSLPFSISADMYQYELWQTMRAYYGQRCGCIVNLGAGYEHPPCHLHAAYHPSSGRSGRLKNSGGWHDAGDYGRYMVNSGITTGTLLWAWEMYSAALYPLALQIPESGG
jgi:endoglucanase